MKNEAKLNIEYGFFLNEAELTRIKYEISEQIKKVSQIEDTNLYFSVKYNNGLIADYHDIGEIVREENFGSKSVKRVSLIAQSGNNSENKIVIKFSDTSNDSDKDDYPISYEIYSDNRDWAFLTSSVIDERIKKIKINSFLNYVFNKFDYNYILVTLPLLMGVVLITLSFPKIDGFVEKVKFIHESSKSLDEYIYRTDLLNAEKTQSLDKFPYPAMWLIFSLVIFFPWLKKIKNIYPLYTFYWGGKIKRYDRRISILKFSFTAIFMAVIIGIFTNFLYDWSKTWI